MKENQELDSQLIGYNVRVIRITQEKTQEEFAEMIDVDVKTIGNIERGHVIPKLQTLANIARNSDKSIDDILGIV